MKRTEYRAARVLAGITDEQLAEAAGLTATTLRAFMAGQRGTDETKAKVDAALLVYGVKVDVKKSAQTITRKTPPPSKQ